MAPDIIVAPPRGTGRLRLLGPGLLWMVAAAGSGELLFSPRAGSLYRYQLLWALLLALVLKWFIAREIGRYAVVTGSSVLQGFAQLRRGARPALALILVPQTVVAVATLAGLAGAAATAWILLLPGGTGTWSLVTLALATVLVTWGRYGVVELLAKLVAAVLGIAAVGAALGVRPSMARFAAGMIPSVPDGLDWSEVLPWLGFAMAGAAGLMWYSYWLPSKGYGARAPADGRARDEDDIRRLRGWLRQMSLDITVAMVGGATLMIAFLVLGAELLAPRKLVPDEDRVADVLGRTLGELWGPWGYWLMVAGLLVGFFGTVLSNQDGWARLFADGTRALAAKRLPRDDSPWLVEARLRRIYALVLLSLAPALVVVLIGQPVALLKLAGAIEAAHIPVVAVLTLTINRRLLPAPLRPSRFTLVATGVAAAFFAAFAGVYLAQLLG